MTNRPFALTADEIKEIAALPEIQIVWGGETAEVMEQILKDIYTVKFHYVNGSPGYVGDLFIIQPEILGGHFPVTRLIRNREQKLEVLK
jgi:hypothetical protein